jgi:predicted MFS family arabinose efflux permease
VNLPIGLLGAAWSLRILPARAAGPRPPFDAAGAGLFAVGLSAALLAVDGLSAPRPAHLGLLLVAGVSALALARRTRRVAAPLVDAALLRNAALLRGLLAGLLSYAAMFTQTFLTPFFLARVLGLPPGRLGLALSAVPVALSVTSPLAGWLSDRFGGRALSGLGMLVLAAGLGALSLSGAGTTLPAAMVRLAVCGVGMGLLQAPNNSGIMGALPRERLGSGGGLLATSRNVGMAIGVALSGSLFALRAGAGATPAAFLPGYALALRAGAILALLAAAASLRLPARR